MRPKAEDTRKLEQSCYSVIRTDMTSVCVGVTGGLHLGRLKDGTLERKVKFPTAIGDE